MSQILKTEKATYIFDSENKNLVLKSNGKFSSVYAGYRLPEKQQVIIKILHPDLTDDQVAIRRFRQEAFPMYVHPKMQQSLDYYEGEGNYVIIKEFIDGKNLRELSKTKIKNPASFFVRSMLLILEMLEDFHREGFVHCDLRPDNILVAEDNSGKINFEYPDVHLLDFGLYRNIHAEDFFTTIPFSMIYSPPEQILNYSKLVDQTSDIYALGITLYECLKGEPAFNNSNPEMLMHLMLNQDLEETSKIDKKLFQIIKTATSKSKFRLPPAQLEETEIIANLKLGQQSRYQNVTEFKIALADYLVKAELKKKSFLFGWNQ